MNKQEKGRIYRFVNENSFQTIKLGDGYEKEHWVIDVPELFSFMKTWDDESEKVVIPKFVADYLEFRKTLHPIGSLGGAITVALRSNQEPEVRNWMNSNTEVFARAWLDGYKVEREPLYEVVFYEKDNFELVLMQLSEHNYEIVDRSENDGYRTQWFTEAEIKAIDERYWLLAVLVEEETK